MEKINKLPKEDITYLSLGEGKESTKNFGLSFTNHVTNREWILDCKFKIGLGIRNLSLQMNNKTISRRRNLQGLESYDYQMEDETHGINQILRNQAEKTGYFFEMGPQKIAIPSMPAWSWNTKRIAYWIGIFLRAVYWLCLILITFDFFRRLIRNQSMESLILMRYICFYFGMTYFGLLKMNNRPVMTEFNRGIHKAIHVGYVFHPEHQFDENSVTGDKIFDKHKITYYGTNVIPLDRMFYELWVYSFVLVFSILLFCLKIGDLFKSLRFVYSIILGFNFLLSGGLNLLNVIDRGTQTEYLWYNKWVSWVMLGFVILDNFYMLVVACVSNYERG